MKKVILALFGSLCFDPLSYAVIEDGPPPRRRGIVTFASNHRWEHHLDTTNNRIVYECRADQLVYYITIQPNVNFELNNLMGEWKSWKGQYFVENGSITTTAGYGFHVSMYWNNFCPGGVPGNFVYDPGNPGDFIEYHYQGGWYTLLTLTEMPYVYGVERYDLTMAGRLTSEFNGQYHFPW